MLHRSAACIDASCGYHIGIDYAVCVQVLEAVRTATLRHTKQGQTCCPELSALRGGPRGRGGEPAVEFARGSADALRVVRHDGGREAGEVVWQVLLRRGTAEAVGGVVDGVALAGGEQSSEVGEQVAMCDGFVGALFPGTALRSLSTYVDLDMHSSF